MLFCQVNILESSNIISLATLITPRLWIYWFIYRWQEKDQEQYRNVLNRRGLQFAMDYYNEVSVYLIFTCKSSKILSNKKWKNEIKIVLLSRMCDLIR